MLSGDVFGSPYIARAILIDALCTNRFSPSNGKILT